VTGLPASDKQILTELTERARDVGNLLQFRSLVGAHQYLRLYRLFRRYVAQGAEVLDWGVGNGHFSYFLTRAGYRAAGHSFEAPAFLDWLGDPGYRFAAGSPADPIGIPFPDESFDAVASVGVLEHVRETGGNETASLREIRRVLRRGGIFVCYHFPNRFSLMDFGARRLQRPHHHVYRYRRGDIDALARSAGFELLEVRRYAILPRNPGYLLPGAVRRSALAAGLWDAADNALTFLLSPVCTNYYFVARRADTARSR
jgi:SAM-dependent methyltransferase